MQRVNSFGSKRTIWINQNNLNTLHANAKNLSCLYEKYHLLYLKNHWSKHRHVCTQFWCIFRAADPNYGHVMKNVSTPLGILVMRVYFSGIFEKKCSTKFIVFLRPVDHFFSLDTPYGSQQPPKIFYARCNTIWN